MIGIFVSLDLFLYYGFWELSLVPMALLIATFGRTENRRRAAIKFFLYTFIPSALLLVAMIWLYVRTGTFDLPTLQRLASQHAISANGPALLLCLRSVFLFAFGVKVPIFPLHGWLSEVVAGRPPSCRHGSRRQAWPLQHPALQLRRSFPEQSHSIAPLLIALGAIGIVYGALLALVQSDLKKLAAFCTLSALQASSCSASSPSPSPGLDGGAYRDPLTSRSTGAALLHAAPGLLGVAPTARSDMRSQRSGLAAPVFRGR